MSDANTEVPRWQPLSKTDRRVLGTLVEKAKTTPDAYPLTVNSLKNGCNQKSNRSPVMSLDEDQIIESLDRLRELGAVVEVQGDGRVPKFRHRGYEWLGVDKVELAVMAELLLRGEQTVGELRGRAARMDPIADLAALRPILHSLRDKGLVVYLTPEGRGCTVTHGLLQPAELERLRTEHGAAGGEEPPPSRPAPAPESTVASQPPVSPQPAASTASAPAMGNASAEVAALRRELEDVRNTLSELQAEMQEVLAIREDLDEIKRQLGV